MAKYINREELLKNINDSVVFSTRNGVSAELRGARKIVDRIRSAPACDVVEVVHSKWIKRNNERRCPICDFFYMTNGTTVYNLCPMCGAKMDETDIDVGTKTNLPDDVRQNILNTFMKGSEN